MTRGLSSCGFQALERMLSGCDTWVQLSYGMWNLPRPEREFMSPALAGGFLTTGPPGKLPISLFFKICFEMDHLKSLYWICYSIASVLCFLSFFFFFFWLWAMWDLAPWAGVEPEHPALEGEVLTTGLPGKSLSYPLLGGPSVCKSCSINPQLFGRNCSVCINRYRFGASVHDAILVPFS